MNTPARTPASQPKLDDNLPSKTKNYFNFDASTAGFKKLAVAVTMLGASSLPALAETAPNAPTLAPNTITAPETAADVGQKYMSMRMNGAVIDTARGVKDIKFVIFPDKNAPAGQVLLFAFVGEKKDKKDEKVLLRYDPQTKRWAEWDGSTITSASPFVNYNFETTVPLQGLEGLTGSVYTAHGGRAGDTGPQIMANVFETGNYAIADAQTDKTLTLPVIKQAQKGEIKTSDPILFTSSADVTVMLGGEYQRTATVNGQSVVDPWTNQSSHINAGDAVQLRLSASENPQESAVAHLITIDDKGETTKRTQEVVTTNGTKAPVTTAPETVKTPEVTKVNATELSTDPDAPTPFCGASLQIVMPAGTTARDIMRVYYNDESSDFLPYSGKPIQADTLGEKYGFSYLNAAGDNVETYFTLQPQKTPDKQP